MSVYSTKAKGWRYDFVMNGRRYSAAGFKTRRSAQQAESERRKEVQTPQAIPETPTDMGFLELVNRRLDYVHAYHSPQHYAEHRSRAKRWIRLWRDRMCSEISRSDIQSFVLKRREVSNHTANKELIRLRAMFNFGIEEGWIGNDPTKGIKKLPKMRVRKVYVPTPEVVEAVIACADPDTQDYLWLMRDTMGRMSEVNRLTWDDVDFRKGQLLLYTRKKRHGDLTARAIPMSERVRSILVRRFNTRSPGRPWVFWNPRTGRPYVARKKIMETLCQKAGVPYFRFHGFRHSGASTLDAADVPIGTIQRLLGHESRETTEIYLHSLRGLEKAAVAVFDRKVVPFSKKSHTNPNELKEESA